VGGVTIVSSERGPAILDLAINRLMGVRHALTAMAPADPALRWPH